MPVIAKLKGPERLEVMEGKSETFHLVLDGQWTGPVTYRIETSLGTAGRQDLFGTSASGSLLVLSTSGSREVVPIEIAAASDDLREPTETGFIEISLTGASFADGSSHASFAIDVIDATGIVSRGGPGEDVMGGAHLDDLLMGRDGDDLLRGRDGADTLKGGRGEDTLVGGAGDDLLAGQGGGDTLRGDVGRDTLKGGGGRDKLNGGTGNDELFGGSGDDLLKGGRGDDILVGGRGHDRMKGNLGSDEMRGGSGKDKMKGGAGDDMLDGGGGDDRLDGGEGNDRLGGGSGDDRLYGKAGDDRIVGGSGNDTIAGSDGEDYIDGGSGSDILSGGSGEDVFVFTGGQDRITDFRPGDAIKVDPSWTGDDPRPLEIMWDIAEKQGDDIVIAFNSGNRLVIENATEDDVTEALFTGGRAIDPVEFDYSFFPFV